MTYEKLVDTGLELGLNKATAAREVGKIVGKLSEAAEAIANKLTCDASHTKSLKGAMVTNLPVQTYPTEQP